MYHHNNRQARAFNRNAAHANPHDDESKRREWSEPHQHPYFQNSFRGRANHPHQVHTSLRNRPLHPRSAHPPHLHQSPNYDHHPNQPIAMHQGSHDKRRNVFASEHREESRNSQFTTYSRHEFRNDASVREGGPGALGNSESTAAQGSRRHSNWEKSQRNHPATVRGAFAFHNEPENPAASQDDAHASTSFQQSQRPDYSRTQSNVANAPAPTKPNYSPSRSEQGPLIIKRHEIQRSQEHPVPIEVKKPSSAALEGEKLIVIKHKSDSNVSESIQPAFTNREPVLVVGKRSGSERLLIEKPTKRQRFSQNDMDTNPLNATDASQMLIEKRQPSSNMQSNFPVPSSEFGKAPSAPIRGDTPAPVSRFSQRQEPNNKEKSEGVRLSNLFVKPADAMRMSSFGSDTAREGRRSQYPDHEYQQGTSYKHPATHPSHASHEREHGNPGSASEHGQSLGIQRDRQFRDSVAPVAPLSTRTHGESFRDAREPMTRDTREEFRTASYEGRPPHRPPWRHCRESPSLPPRPHAPRFGPESNEPDRMQDRSGPPSAMHEPAHRDTHVIPPARRMGGSDVSAPEGMDDRSRPNAHYPGDYSEPHRPPYHPPPFSTPPPSKRFSFSNAIPETHPSVAPERLGHDHPKFYRGKDGPALPPPSSPAHLERTHTYPPTPGPGARQIDETFRSPPHMNGPSFRHQPTHTFHGRQDSFPRSDAPQKPYPPHSDYYYTEREGNLLLQHQFEKPPTSWGDRPKGGTGFPGTLHEPLDRPAQRESRFSTRPPVSRSFHPRAESYSEAENLDHYTEEFPPMHRLSHIPPHADLDDRVHMSRRDGGTHEGSLPHRGWAPTHQAQGQYPGADVQQESTGVNLNHFRFVRKKALIKSPLMYATGSTDKRLYDALHNFRLAKDKFNVSLLLFQVTQAHLLKSTSASEWVTLSDNSDSLNTKSTVHNQDVVATTE